MSNKLAADIFKESRRTPFILMDIVLIAGIMRRKLGYGDCNIMVCVARSYLKGKGDFLESVKLS